MKGLRLWIFVSIIITFIGLIYYGKALELNQQHHDLSKQLLALEQENQRLELNILKTKNLKTIEEKARQELDMVPIKNIIYIKK